MPLTRLSCLLGRPARPLVLFVDPQVDVPLLSYVGLLVRRISSWATRLVAARLDDGNYQAISWFCMPTYKIYVRKSLEAGHTLVTLLFT